MIQVLAGSNKCGRLDHHVDDGQNQVAELSRLESIKERCPHVKAEMEKGNPTLQKKQIPIVL